MSWVQVENRVKKLTCFFHQVLRRRGIRFRSFGLVRKRDLCLCLLFDISLMCCYLLCLLVSVSTVCSILFLLFL